MKTLTLGFIGVGRITRILLQGFSNKKALSKSILVFEPNAEIRDALIKDFPRVKAAGSAAEAAEQKVVFIAVHPPVVMETLQAFKESTNDETIVISLAPKITIEKMASVLLTKNLVRMIPKATSIINEGYNPLTLAVDFDEKQKKKVFKLLKKLGKTFETEESKLEAYAIVSAMLPTYFWFQWHEMEIISKEIGLTAVEAQKTISSTLKKAWKLYYKSGLAPAQVMDLIPVKPIGENEPEIKNILNTRLIGLYDKIRP